MNCRNRRTSLKIKDYHWIHEQEMLLSWFSTGWFQVRIRAWNALAKLVVSQSQYYFLLLFAKHVITTVISKIPNVCNLSICWCFFVYICLGLSENFGACVAEPVSIRSFKRFFIQLDLPYKATRLEHFDIKATIFNYETEKTVV